MSRCRFCSNEAVYNGMCFEHFKKFLLKKVVSVIYIAGLMNKRLLVGVSGGKDSAVTAQLLMFLREKFNLDIELLHVKLGIKGYSDESLDSCSSLSKKLGLKLNVVDVKEEYGKGVDDLAVEFSSKGVPVCSVCGTIKRYLMNKFAFENDFDFVITGHNLDDEASFLLQAVKEQQIELILRNGVFSPSKRDFKLVGKAKPLYFIREEDVEAWASLNKLPIVNKKCPYSFGNKQFVNKKVLKDVNEEFRGVDFRNSLVKTFFELRRLIPDDKKKVIALRRCSVCGFATTKSVCRFCRIMGLG